jgi:hypothetical protein
MKERKRELTLSGAVLVTALVVGCGGQSGSQPPPSPGPADAGTGWAGLWACTGTVGAVRESGPWSGDVRITQLPGGDISLDLLPSDGGAPGSCPYLAHTTGSSGSFYANSPCDYFIETGTLTLDGSSLTFFRSGTNGHYAGDFTSGTCTRK